MDSTGNCRLHSTYLQSNNELKSYTVYELDVVTGNKTY
jgi:hypothetical protein